MKHSTKIRYGLAVVMVLSQRKEITALITIANQLGLSKTYLEQVLSLLKSHQIVESIKGPSGGYRLVSLENLDLYTLFSALDLEITEAQDEQSFSDQKLNLLLNREVFIPLDKAIKNKLKSIKIIDLAQMNQEEMYYI